MKSTNQLDLIAGYKNRRFKLLKVSTRVIIAFSILFTLFVIFSLAGESSIAVFGVLISVYFEGYFMQGKPNWLDGINPYTAKSPGQLYRRLCLLHFSVLIETAFLGILFLTLSSEFRLQLRAIFLSMMVIPMTAISVVALIRWSKVTKEMTVRMANMGLRSVSAQLPSVSQD